MSSNNSCLVSGEVARSVLASKNPRLTKLLCKAGCMNILQISGKTSCRNRLWSSKNAGTFPSFHSESSDHAGFVQQLTFFGELDLR